MQGGFPQDHYAEVHGLRLRYWTKGRGEDALLLHGLGGSVEDWAGAFERLSGDSGDFRLWALELPGSGRSDKQTRGYSVDLFGRIVVGFLDLHGIKQPHIVGVSMGGGIGLALALRLPARVGRLVLVNSALLGRRLHPFLHLCTLPVLGELLLQPTPKVVERYISWCVGDPESAPAEWVSTHKELAMLPGAKQAFLATLRAANSVFGTKKREFQPILSGLPRLSAETLIICGERDRFIPKRYAVRAARRIPHARLVLFSKCGHVPHVECPDRFYSLVAAFLAGGLAGLVLVDPAVSQSK